MNKKKIEIHTSEFDGLKIDVRRIDSNAKNITEKIKKAHRDDHYIFYIQERGCTQLMIDFKNYTLAEKAFFFICPGQVHYYQKQINSNGYFLFIDASFVTSFYRSIFENHQNLNQAFSLAQSELSTIIELIDFQLTHYANNDIQAKIIHSLTDSLTGMMIHEIFKSEDHSNKSTDRRTSITHQFRKSIRKNFVALKKPKDYAALLHISVPYLNEVVKEATGYAASYWIQQEILLEAKRLLHYTDLNSKEIAFSLGYEDYAYFSRFFKKNTNLTPLEFRNNSLDLSNNNF